PHRRGEWHQRPPGGSEVYGPTAPAAAPAQPPPCSAPRPCVKSAGWRRRGGAIASAVAAARSENAAATAGAGRKPSVMLAGDPRCPYAAKTEPATAIAKTAPKRCIMLLMPDAFPRSGGGAADRGAVGTGGRAIETPMPAASSAGKSY